MVHRRPSARSSGCTQDGERRSDVPTEPPKPIDDMVEIPAGPFILGSDETEPNESPAQTMELPAYDPDTYPTVRDWVRDTIETARALPGAGGAYLSFSADQGTDERLLHQQYGGNLERLRAIKKRYDPGNLLRVNNNITPA